MASSAPPPASAVLGYTLPEDLPCWTVLSDGQAYAGNHGIEVGLYVGADGIKYRHLRMSVPSNAYNRQVTRKVFVNADRLVAASSATCASLRRIDRPSHVRVSVNADETPPANVKYIPNPRAAPPRQLGGTRTRRRRHTRRRARRFF